MNPLARSILRQQPVNPVRLAYGVMASATTVNIEGDATAVPVPQVESAGLLESGDYVAIQIVGADALVLGKVGAPPTSDTGTVDGARAGTIWITRVGQVVTIEFDVSGQPAGAIGTIGSQYLPASGDSLDGVGNTYTSANAGSGVAGFRVIEASASLFGLYGTTPAGGRFRGSITYVIGAAGW